MLNPKTSRETLALNALKIASANMHRWTGTTGPNSVAFIEAMKAALDAPPDKPNESPYDRPELTFDGKGINGPDEYRTRIATFNHPDSANQDAKKYGPLFASSPILAAAVLMVENNAPQSAKIDPESHYVIGLKGSQIEQLRRAAKEVRS